MSSLDFSADPYERLERELRSGFPRELARALESRGMSRGVLAYKSGIHVNTINHYINGKTVPDIVKLKRIAHCLGMSAGELIDFPLSTDP